MKQRPQVRQSLPRVLTNTISSAHPIDGDRQTTRSITTSITPKIAAFPPIRHHPAPRVQTTPPPRTLKKRRKSIPVPVPPAANTWSKEREKKRAIKQQRELSRKPAINPKRESKLHQPTRNLRSARRQMQPIKNDVHKALAVMDKKSGKMLNYRQLLRHPDYKKGLESVISQRIWTSCKWSRRKNKKSN